MQLFQLSDAFETSPAGFTKRMLAQSSAALLFVLNFEPGQKLPPHTHAESEIVVTVLNGEGEATVDDRNERLQPGEALRCQGQETFSVRNGGTSRLSLLVFLAPGDPRFAGNVR